MSVKFQEIDRYETMTIQGSVLHLQITLSNWEKNTFYLEEHP